MKNTVEKYYFIRENKVNHTIEYFDFESNRYTNKKVLAVSLSTIDSMTSYFDNPEELDDYFERENNNNSQQYKYMIIHSDKSNKNSLHPIWGDYRISSLSRVSNENVDFTHDLNCSLLLEILEKIKDSSNGLAKRIVKSSDEETELCVYNKTLVAVLASSDKIPSIEVISQAFKPYKEFRALYLNYKKNIEKNTSFKDQLQKLKTKLF